MLSMPTQDEDMLRLAFDVADRALERGNHPFGAVLAGPDGEVLLEAENGYLPDGDMTAHAERLLATAACKAFEPEELAECTLYSSAEPCAMCAGAIYWAGIGRVVYGLSIETMTELGGADADELLLHCADVLAYGMRPVEVIGPALEDEARRVFEETPR